MASPVLLALYVAVPLLTVTNVALTLGLAWAHWHAAQEPEVLGHTLHIIAMVPLYGLMAALCLAWPRHFLYFELVRESYEALVLWRFYQLLLLYLRRQSTQVFQHRDKCVVDTAALTEEAFVALPAQSLGCCMAVQPSTGLLTRLRHAVLQYVVLRALMPPIMIALHALGLYSNRQPDPRGGYLWLTLLCTVSLSVALGALWLLIRLSRPVIWRYGPTTKLLAVKLVVFFIFWQSLLLSVAAYCGAVPPGLLGPGWSLDLTTEVLHSALLSFELAWLALYHHWIFAADEHQATASVLLTSIEGGRHDDAVM